MGSAKHYVFCALVALAASTANAGPVIYAFSASFSGNPFGSFTYTAPSLITSNQTVPASSLDTCVVTFPSDGLCGTITFFTDTSSIQPVGSNNDAIGFTVTSVFSGTLTFFYYFVNGALSAPGVYNTVLLGEEQAATLSVVPEPATLALIGIGLAGLGFARRRKQ